MARRPRIERALKYFVVLVVLVVLGHGLLQGDRALLRLFSGLSSAILVGMVATLISAKAAQYSLDSTFGRTLWLVTQVVAYWLFGQLGALIYEYILASQPPRPGFIDAAQLAFYAVVLYAIVFFFRAARAKFTRYQLAEAALPALALLLASAALVIAPAYGRLGAPGPAEWFDMMHPVLTSLLLFVTVLLVLLFKRETVAAGARLMLSGFAVYALGGLLLSYEKLNAAYYAGGFSTALILLGFSMVGLGAGLIEKDAHELYRVLTGFFFLREE